MNNLLVQLSDVASKQEPINSGMKEDESASVLPSPIVLNPLKNRSAENISLDDRKIIREKMKAAYRKKASSYEELIELCTLVDEEQIFKNAPSKLDYYKNGIHCVKTIFEKKSQIDSGVQETDLKKPLEDTDAAPKSLKRAKTQH